MTSDLPECVLDAALDEDRELAVAGNLHGWVGERCMTKTSTGCAIVEALRVPSAIKRR